MPALLLSLSLGICTRLSLDASRVVPDGRLIETKTADRPYRLAYIDASHLEAFSDKNWMFDAINGLALTLMRNGYLVATMPEVTQERLERADIVVSIAPARPFSEEERQRLHTFVQDGGILICTVGAEQAPASASLLHDFGLRIPVSQVSTLGQWQEPEPMGHFRSLFLSVNDSGNGDYKAGVVFYTGWPVEAEGEDAEFLVHGKKNVPLVVSRKLGQGRIIVIGDPGFALNKNLEYIGGQPFDGRYENAHFWRWLISHVTGRKEWFPPAPLPLSPAVEEKSKSEKGKLG